MSERDAFRTPQGWNVAPRRMLGGVVGWAAAPNGLQADSRTLPGHKKTPAPSGKQGHLGAGVSSC
jgi:hypothetical protein